MLNAPTKLKALLDGSTTVSRVTRYKVARAGAWGSSRFLSEEEEILRRNILKYTGGVCGLSKLWGDVGRTKAGR